MFEEWAWDTATLQNFAVDASGKVLSLHMRDCLWSHEHGHGQGKLSRRSWLLTCGELRSTAKACEPCSRCVLLRVSSRAACVDVPWCHAYIVRYPRHVCAGCCCCDCSSWRVGFLRDAVVEAVHSQRPAALRHNRDAGVLATAVEPIPVRERHALSGTVLSPHVAQHHTYADACGVCCSAPSAISWATAATTTRTCGVWSSPRTCFRGSSHRDCTQPRWPRHTRKRCWHRVASRMQRSWWTTS